MTYEQAITYYGSATKLAKAVGVSGASIVYWKKNGIPETRQYQLQVLTNGDLTAGGPVSSTASSD